MKATLAPVHFLFAINIVVYGRGSLICHLSCCVDTIFPALFADCTVFSLGQESFHVLVIRSWQERLDHLTKANDFVGAINLAVEFYNDHGKALVGLRGPR